MVLPTFVRQALRREPITVYGDGKQRRSFTYVLDVVDALIKIGECGRAVGQVFNIGNGYEITIEDLAHKVKALVNSNSAIHYIPYDQAYGEGFEDMPRRVPSIDKIQSYIDWKPSVQLDEIIQSVIDYFAASADGNLMMAPEGNAASAALPGRTQPGLSHLGNTMPTAKWGK
jgi:UDP-glucose 4-epimerase